MRGHVPMSETLAAAKKLRMERIVFTHIGHRTGTHAELSEWMPAGAEVAYDGLTIDL